MRWMTWLAARLATRLLLDHRLGRSQRIGRWRRETTDPPRDGTTSRTDSPSVPFLPVNWRNFSLPDDSKLAKRCGISVANVCCLFRLLLRPTRVLLSRQPSRDQHASLSSKLAHRHLSGSNGCVGWKSLRKYSAKQKGTPRRILHGVPNHRMPSHSLSRTNQAWHSNLPSAARVPSR
jgi:hypothetical protein